MLTKFLSAVLLRQVAPEQDHHILPAKPETNRRIGEEVNFEHPVNQAEMDG
ncbi:hypothetical protein [Saccharopolyspora elongata]|uniref:hypothetical protein n=1 Tax=Saccharopolyspora elongata TaxID=2530387 RepID=UPI00140502D4|nr:hypothetical protein [Saccharopolyspora elongata]